MQKLTTIFSATVLSLIVLATPALAQAQNAAGTTATGPSIKLITPQENQTVYGDKIPVLFDIQNFTLTDFQTNPRNVAGLGHIHLWLDTQNPTAESATKIFKDEFTFTDISYGEHTLKAELINNNHTPLTPAQVVTIKFRNEAIPSPTPAENSAFDKNTALVILVIVALVIVAAWWYTKEEDEEMAEELETETKKKKTKKTTKKKTTKKAAPRSRRR